MKYPWEPVPLPNGLPPPGRRPCLLESHPSLPLRFLQPGPGAQPDPVHAFTDALGVIKQTICRIANLFRLLTAQRSPPR